jgi:hypothetical protein
MFFFNISFFFLNILMKQFLKECEHDKTAAVMRCIETIANATQ